MVYMSTMSTKPGNYGNAVQPKVGSGRVGTNLNMVHTKDRMGFDKEVVARCQTHEGKCIDTVYKHRRADKKAADELSGETAKRAKAGVTLQKFSWDEKETDDERI